MGTPAGVAFSQQRIRASALVVSEGSLLLVRHTRPGEGEWWAPPGGGVEGGESVYDCAAREVLEETGLTVQLGKVVYLRQFLDVYTNTHNFEVFLQATDISGGPTAEGRPASGPRWRPTGEARFFTPEELTPRVVYPDILKGSFWQDVAAGHPTTRYLGVHVG